MAKLVASWSKDMSTQVGAVIVRPDVTVASTGFNGFPQRMQDNAAWYEDRNEKYSRILHAEINALLFAREQVTGYFMYSYPFLPCERCAVQIIQAGISRVISPITPIEKQERWSNAFAKAEAYFSECGVEYTAIRMA